MVSAPSLYYVTIYNRDEYDIYSASATNHGIGIMTVFARKTGLNVYGAWVYRGLRWGLAMVFLYAGAIKLADPYAFATLIEAYGLIPDVFLMPVAVGLPALEVMAAIGLIFDVRGSLLVMAVLLVLFILVLGYGLWMGLDVDCGCFGPEDPEGKAFAGIRPALYRDIVLAGGVLLLYGWRRCFGVTPVGVQFSSYATKEEETHAKV